MIWNTASSTLWDNRLAHLLTLTTEAATTIDYYFIYGPEPDQMIHQYRELTGHAPMFGKWAYGLLQSKDRYESQSDLLNVVNEYAADTSLSIQSSRTIFGGRSRAQVNSIQIIRLSPTRSISYIKSARTVMISIWPDFDTDTPISREMTERNWLISGLKCMTQPIPSS